MTAEYSNIIPKPNPWFISEIAYAGQGQAWLRGVNLPLSGPATVQFDEAGVSHVEMRVQGMIEVLVPLGFAECERMTVTTNDGTFSASKTVRYGCQHNKSTDETVLTFQFLQSQFNATQAGPPKYWVLPLLNFLSEFMEDDLAFAHHPLRLNGTLEESDSQLDLEELLAKYEVSNNSILSYQNRLITFKFGGEGAYVEPLVDYEARKRRLEEHDKPIVITALMVGEIGAHSLDLTDLETWFPFDYLLLLGLATGTGVGAPWIEFRDGDNNLVRRVHVRFHMDSASLPIGEGHAAIREDVQRGTGHLLTIAPSSPHWNKSYLRLALRHLLQVRTNGLLEDALNHLIIPLDAICKEFGLDRTDLLQKLDKRTQKKINTALGRAQVVVSTASQKAIEQGAFDQSRILDRIARRTESCPVGLDKSFGLAVTELLARFGLSDADILDAFLKTAGATRGLDKWSGVLNHYRGITIHEGYFNMGAAHDLHGIWCVINHLHDVLLRVVLKMLNYDGEYQPTVVVDTFSAPLDWVGPHTPANQLGYK